MTRLLIAALLLTFAGCGGDSALTGVLLGPIEGVSYETNTLSGVTDETGTFQYNDGEVVRFFLGATTLGEAFGAEELSLFDLVDGAEPVVGNRAIADALFADNQFYDSVVNRAVLLGTLDFDNDDANGFQITEEVAALFESAAVDFDQSLFRFGTDVVFRGVLNRANAASLLLLYRAFLIPERAAAALYRTVGIDPAIMGTVRSTVDVGNDGVVDAIDTSEFNSDGQVVRFTMDDNADGTPSFISRSMFDNQGRFTRNDVDSDGDGTLDGVLVSTRDMDGNVVRFEQDTDGDGMNDSVSTRDFDDTGRLLVTRDDSDADGTTDSIRTNEYDARGLRVRTETDIDADGTAESIETLEYDSEGRETLSSRDLDADGTVDRTTTSTYDVFGRLIERLTEEGGVVTNRQRFEYNADGRQTLFASDSDGDGVDNFVNQTFFDADGNNVRSEFDNDADGTPDRVTTREHDEDGNVTREVEDSDGDGTADGIETRAYDEFGNLVRWEFDTNADGTVDEVRERMFGPAGFA